MKARLNFFLKRTQGLLALLIIIKILSACKEEVKFKTIYGPNGEVFSIRDLQIDTTRWRGVNGVKVTFQGKFSPEHMQESKNTFNHYFYGVNILSDSGMVYNTDKEFTSLPRTAYYLHMHRGLSKSKRMFTGSISIPYILINVPEGKHDLQLILRVRGDRLLWQNLDTLSFSLHKPEIIRVSFELTNLSLASKKYDNYAFDPNKQLPDPYWTIEAAGHTLYAVPFIRNSRQVPPGKVDLKITKGDFLEFAVFEHDRLSPSEVLGKYMLDSSLLFFDEEDHDGNYSYSNDNIDTLKYSFKLSEVE